MKLLWGFMLLAIIGLQARLWTGEGGIVEVWDLQDQVSILKDENSVLEQRNARLDAKVIDLKKGYEVIEEHARLDLGMISKGETFFLVVNQETF